MSNWKLKSCPRCGGDLFLDMDAEHHWYEECLQCAYQRELRNAAEFNKERAAAEKEPVPVGVRRKK
ncbi:MAG: hypothetical protein V1849_01370 [Chloroflexota bacterium]